VKAGTGPLRSLDFFAAERQCDMVVFFHSRFQRMHPGHRNIDLPAFAVMEIRNPSVADRRRFCGKSDDADNSLMLQYLLQRFIFQIHNFPLPFSR
jgi:hypothetical protein